MKILVTGGLGFIGSNFIRHMLETHGDLSIVNLDSQTYAGNPANLSDYQNSPRYRWIRADIADPAAVEAAMTGTDAVIHFAAETHVDRSIQDSSLFLKTNVLGTRTLLEAALQLHIPRFLHVSTDEVYGSVETGFSREDDPLLPNSPYAASKAASDLLVRSYHVTYGLPALISRASNNFGPYQYPEKALPLMITRFLDDQPFPLYGDGKNVRDWLYVLDHVRALELLLEKGRPGEIYNVGGTFSCENRELAETVRRLMGKPKTLVTPVTDRPGHDRRYALDCSKLLALGFKHAASFNQSLQQTLAWYQDHQTWWRPLQSRGDFRSYYRKQYAERA